MVMVFLWTTHWKINIVFQSLFMDWQKGGWGGKKISIKSQNFGVLRLKARLGNRWAILNYGSTSISRPDMSFFQIYKHLLFIACRLLGEKIANTILPKIECCSEVEEDSAGAYQSRQVPWRSPSYNILLVSLDNHTVDYLHEFKGKNCMMKCPEYHKGYNGGPSSQSPFPTLPKNCYSKRFLEEISHSQRIAVDVQPAWTNL